MTKIRVKIFVEEGFPKKPGLIQCLCDAEAYINKIADGKDFFFLITDNVNMVELLTEESRMRFRSKGMEIQFPPEYDAARMVILKNVDNIISNMSEEEIERYIGADFKVRKIIKIPNSPHLLKIIFHDTKTADRAIQGGMKIHFQVFKENNIEKEVFVAVVPCNRCYSCEHQKRSCTKPQTYQICSSCAEEGHTYTECETERVKCINCKGNHRTLAAKCPKRKALIRKKIKENRERSKANEIRVTPQSRVAPHMPPQMPENYMAVMAAAITIAEKREMDELGSFQYIMDEMLKANKIPRVIFPESVIKKGTHREESQIRKRQRSSEEGRGDVAQTQKQDEEQYILLTDGSWRNTKHLTPTPTPHTTPRSTPTSTPAPTPSSSPQRQTGAVGKKLKQQSESEDPGILLVVRSDVVLSPTLNYQQIKKEIKKEKIMKYVYTNIKYNQETIKRNVEAVKYDLTKCRKVPIAQEHFQQVKTGGAYKLENILKIERE